MSRFSRPLLILAILSLSSSALLAQEKSETPPEVIKLEVDKTEVETGELFTYQLTIEGEFDQPELTLPEFKDFGIASQNQSRNYSVAQGKTKLTLAVRLQLFAAQPGSFLIEEAALTDGDKVFKSKPVTIEVSGRPLPEKKILPYIEEGTDI